MSAMGRRNWIGRGANTFDPTQCAQLRCVYLNGARGRDVMIEIIEILRQEHRNLEKLLRVMEQELRVFDRAERPDYEVFAPVGGAT